MGAMISTKPQGDYNAAFATRNPPFALQHDGNALLRRGSREDGRRPALRATSGVTRLSQRDLGLSD
jgi:hypothetical protein